MVAWYKHLPNGSDIVNQIDYPGHIQRMNKAKTDKLATNRHMIWVDKIGHREPFRYIMLAVVRMFWKFVSVMFCNYL